MNNDNATQWSSQNAGDLCNADIDAVVLKHSQNILSTQYHVIMLSN